MPRNVIVELAPSAPLAAASFRASSRLTGPARAFPERARVAADALDVAQIPALAGLLLDASFPPTPVPDPEVVPRTEGGTVAARTGARAFDVRRRVEVNLDPQETPYIVRGEIDDDAQADALRAVPEVRNVYADLPIAPCPVCPDSPAVGTVRDVARLLGVDRLAAAGMDGRGVLVAIVDTGINLAHLRGRGLNPSVDRARSWEPAGVNGDPFEFPVGHGTMCAYDALIAAPRATLLDVAVLLSQAPNQPGSAVSGLLSDAIAAYSHLLAILRNPSRRPGEALSLVVSNSWAIFSPAWDFAPGHPGNYTDNPEHLFNRSVTTLEAFGADILFAAGNCGADCADGRCEWADGESTIAGANGHPAVLSVAGVDVTGERVGYSSTGPGRLSDRKPDISGFTHFRGSDVYPSDGGTSAACPVVAGVVAAVRSRLASSRSGSGSPAAVRDMVRKTALERGNPGFDYAYGWGIVNGHRLSELSVQPSAAPLVDPEQGVAALEAAFRGTPAATAGAPQLTANIGVKTVVARVTAEAEIKDASIGVRAEPPVFLTGSDPKNKSAEVTTNSLGVLLFDFRVTMEMEGIAWNFTLTDKATGKTVRNLKEVTREGGVGTDRGIVEF